MSAAKILELLKSRGMKLAVAESLTGGLLTYEFSKVPGASKVLLAGVVAYDTALKSQLLGVSASLLENQGPVDPEVAAQMAEGLRRSIATKKQLGIENIVSVATTGVAGPETQAEQPVGQVFIATASGNSETPNSNVFAHELVGSRVEIQKAVVLLAVEHLWEEISG